MNCENGFFGIIDFYLSQRIRLAQQRGCHETLGWYQIK
jgi:hypothetical protein